MEKLKKNIYIWEQKLVSPEEQMIQFIIKESSTAVQHHGYQKFPYLEIPSNPFFSELKFEKCKIRVPKFFKMPHVCFSEDTPFRHPKNFRFSNNLYG